MKVASAELLEEARQESGPMPEGASYVKDYGHCRWYKVDSEGSFWCHSNGRWYFLGDVDIASHRLMSRAYFAISNTALIEGWLKANED